MLLLRIGSFTASTGCINVTEQVLQQLKTLTLYVSLKGGEKKKTQDFAFRQKHEQN